MVKGLWSNGIRGWDIKVWRVGLSEHTKEEEPGRFVFDH